MVPTRSLWLRRREWYWDDKYARGERRRQSRKGDERVSFQRDVRERLNPERLMR